MAANNMRMRYLYNLKVVDTIQKLDTLNHCSNVVDLFMH